MTPRIYTAHALVTEEADPPEGAAIDPGLAVLRSTIGHLLPGDVVVVGGRRNAGKSHVALAMLAGMARAGVRGLYVSLEDGLTRVARRVRAGYLVEGIHTTFPSLALTSSLVEVIEASAKLGIRVWAVDYIQKMRHDGEAWSGGAAVGLCIAELEAAVTRAGGALVLLSQVKQPGKDDDPDELPGPYAMRESAAIEDAADVVLVVGDVKGRPRLKITKAKDAAVPYATFALHRDPGTGVLSEPLTGAAEDNDDW